MDIEKLKPYEEYSTPIKSFTGLCRILGVAAPRNGQEREKMEANFKRYFDFDKCSKQSNQITVREIYSEPLPEPEIPMHGNATLAKYIEPILVNDLAECDGEKIYATSTLYLLLDMINKNYLNDIEYLKKNDLTYDSWQTNRFYYICDNKLKVLTSALKSMKRRGIIDFSKQWYVKDWNDSLRVAEPEDVEKIKKTEKEVLEEMGLKAKPIYNKKSYYKNFDSKIRECHGWQRAYQLYDIKLLKTNNAVAEDEVIECKKTINNIIVTAVNEQAQKEYSENQILCEEKRTELAMEYADDTGTFGRPRAISFNERDWIDGLYFYPSDFCETIKELADHFLLIDYLDDSKIRDEANRYFDMMRKGKDCNEPLFGATSQ